MIPFLDSWDGRISRNCLNKPETLQCLLYTLIDQDGYKTAIYQAAGAFSWRVVKRAALTFNYYETLCWLKKIN